jgi:hypothetical protein
MPRATATVWSYRKLVPVLLGPRYEDVYPRWRPRIGTTAARCYWVTVKGYAIAPQVVGITVVAVCLRIIFPSLATTVAVSVMATLCVLVAVVVLVGTPLSRYLTTRSTGVQVGLFTGANQPPVDDAEYQRWCSTNGIRPNAAD